MFKILTFTTVILSASLLAQDLSENTPSQGVLRKTMYQRSKTQKDSLRVTRDPARLHVQPYPNFGIGMGGSGYWMLHDKFQHVYKDVGEPTTSPLLWLTMELQLSKELTIHQNTTLGLAEMGLHTVSASLCYRFLHSGTFQPFIGGGAGIYIFDLYKERGDYLASGHGKKWGLQYVAGIDIGPYNRDTGLTLFAQYADVRPFRGRLHDDVESQYDNTPITVDISGLMIGARLTFYFGGY
ncbi:MAG TPA: hypothetical protein PLG25_06155 [bacterium]|nr:hypothetical protein [bacterium]HMW35801.1 hypothetical protein [bacterium]HMY35067.1 hypothetical protein [bacterium]HNE83436.1 hypothetical protein [bacterium]HNH30390.1 hypothetical protein [bacterium]